MCITHVDMRVINLCRSEICARRAEDTQQLEIWHMFDSWRDLIPGFQRVQQTDVTVVRKPVLIPNAIMVRTAENNGIVMFDFMVVQL